jgi:hypothetical protein
MVAWLTLWRVASDSSEVVVVQWSMNCANTAALLILLRCLVQEAPQVLHRHQVVPFTGGAVAFHIASAVAAWSVLGITPPHHGYLSHH